MVVGVARNADELSEQEAIIARKALDLEWYARNAPLMILAKDGQNVPLSFNAPQRIVHRIVSETRARRDPLRLVILKARKEGVSTYFCADFCHIAHTRNNQECYMMAQDQEHGAKLFEKIEHMHFGLDPYFRVERLGQNVGKRLKLANGSNLFVASAHKGGSGRSMTPHHVHLTELPDWPDPEKTLTGLTQAVPKPQSNWFTSIVLESTAQGIGDFWYYECKRAQRGQSAYRFVFLPWFIMDEYARPPLPREIRDDPLTAEEEEIGKLIVRAMPAFGLPKPTPDEVVAKLMFRRDTILEIGYDKWNQEFPGTPDDAFLASGRPYFPRAAVKSHRNRQTEKGHDVVCEPRRRCDIREVGDVAPDKSNDRRQRTEYRLVDSEKGPLQVWLPPEAGARYIVSGDIASAEAQDYSASHVLRVDGQRIEQVAVWHGHIPPTEFAYVLAFLGSWYNKALLVPESNSFGRQTVIELTHRIRYGRVYREMRMDAETMRESAVYGFETNSRTRPAMLEQLHDYIRTFDLLLRHEETLNEIAQFAINRRGKPEAPVGGHDDLVTSLAMGVYARPMVGSSRVKVVQAPGAKYLR